MGEFKSQELFQQITDGLKGMDDKEKKDIQKKVRFFPSSCFCCCTLGMMCTVFTATSASLSSYRAGRQLFAVVCSWSETDGGQALRFTCRTQEQPKHALLSAARFSARHAEPCTHVPQKLESQVLNCSHSFFFPSLSRNHLRFNLVAHDAALSTDLFCFLRVSFFRRST